MKPRRAIGWTLYGLGGLCLATGLLGHTAAFASAASCLCAGTVCLFGPGQPSRR